MKLQHFTAVTSVLKNLFVLRVMFRVYVYRSGSDTYPVLRTRFSPTGTRLTGARVTDARITGIRVTGARLTCVRVTGARITGARVTVSQNNTVHKTFVHLYIRCHFRKSVLGRSGQPLAFGC